MSRYRKEHDTQGEVRVPADALYGAQTQRAVDNFTISGLRVPRRLIEALGLIKAAAARVNGALGLLDPDAAEAIEAAAQAVAEGEHDVDFPVDVFQTGSGTSTNMNANEVIAALAGRRLGRSVHPNDHVNLGQSSNDVFPSAVHVAASLEINRLLAPLLRHLEEVVRAKAAEVGPVVKTGRTHLMDALPLTVAQELLGWAAQIAAARNRIESAREPLSNLALGGTAVGTGVNTAPAFASAVAQLLGEWTGVAFCETPDHFAAQSAMDDAVALSGQLKALAVALMKIANDLRWMNSGPMAGLGEISLPALQPGSSIMPAKVNPVIPEAVAMVCAQVIGNDTTITIAGQSGNFQLNVMLPVLAYNLLQSITLLANAVRALADKAVAGFVVNVAAIGALVERNPILVTALNPVVGYEKAAEIAKKAMAEGLSIKEVALALTELSAEELDRLLDPLRLTEGGLGSGTTRRS